MSARAELRAAPIEWRESHATLPLTRADLLRATYRHHPTLARVLRVTVLRAACRARETANELAKTNVRTARWHAEEARRLAAVADILQELTR